MSLHPLVVTISLVKDRAGRTLMEIEVVLENGDIISKTVRADKIVRLDFTADCEVSA